MSTVFCRLARHRLGLGRVASLTLEPGFLPRSSKPLFPRPSIHRTSSSFGPRAKPNAFDIFDIRKSDTRTRLAIAIFGGCSVYYLYHLERVPVTGRIRFMDVTPEQELSLATQTYRQLLSEFEGKILPQDHILTRHVRRVASRILEGSNLGRVDGEQAPGGVPSSEVSLGEPWSAGFVTEGQQRDGSRTEAPDKEWKVLVINDDSVINAAVINGIVIVFTGILPICKGENGLAAVLGHEVAHVLARHGAERISSNRILTILAFILDPLLGIHTDLTQLVTTYAFQLPNSRTQELEADRMGLTLTAQACYDPHVVPDMQKRLAVIESKGPKAIEFLRTHPSSARRAEILESYLPDAYSVQAASSFCAGMENQLNFFRDATTGYGWSLGAKDEKPSEWREHL